MCGPHTVVIDYCEQLSRLTGDKRDDFDSRPEHVALRTRYERRNTIEAGIKGGSMGCGQILMLGWDVTCKMDDLLLLCLFISSET